MGIPLRGRFGAELAHAHCESGGDILTFNKSAIPSLWDVNPVEQNLMPASRLLFWLPVNFLVTTRLANKKFAFACGLDIIQLRYLHLHPS